MSAVHVLRRLISWIALWAMLLAAVLPTLGHALAASPQADWMAVCSAQGTRWVQADPADTAPVPGTPQPGAASEHCPWCAWHTTGLAPAPAAALLHLPLQLAHVLPTAFLAAPRTLHAWVQAQPRAPPPFS